MSNSKYTTRVTV